jgi:hypothetical protein
MADGRGVAVTTSKAVLLELFAVVWILWVEFMPYEWHGALTLGVVIGLVGLLYGFWSAESGSRTASDSGQ